MTQIEFGRLLNEMMEALDESKNEIISRTGIDRSTFFKFLNGKRFPTADQLNVIISKSGISESDGRKLRKAYDETHYSHVLYNYIEVASQCLNAMMEASYIREYVRSKASPGTNLKIGSETIHGICGILQNEIQGRRDIEHAILTFLNSEIFRGGDRNLLLSSPNRYKVSDKEPELYSALQQQGSLAVSLLRYSE